jgi:hypothetical protein
MIAEVDVLTPVLCRVCRGKLGGAGRDRIVVEHKKRKTEHIMGGAVVLWCPHIDRAKGLDENGDPQVCGARNQVWVPG